MVTYRRIDDDGTANNYAQVGLSATSKRSLVATGGGVHQ